MGLRVIYSQVHETVALVPVAAMGWIRVRNTSTVRVRVTGMTTVRVSVRVNVRARLRVSAGNH